MRFISIMTRILIIMLGRAEVSSIPTRAVPSLVSNDLAALPMAKALPRAILLAGSCGLHVVLCFVLSLILSKMLVRISHV